MKTLCSYYITIDVACLTLSALYIYKGKNFYVYFFQTQGEIDLEIDTDCKNKYDIYSPP